MRLVFGLRAVVVAASVGMPLYARASEVATSSSEVATPSSEVDAPRRSRRSRRSGKAMMATGGALLGLGVLGRIAIEGFWVGVARLEPREPFGAWSLPNIALFTAFSNAFVLPGLTLMSVGVGRYGRWRAQSEGFVAPRWTGRRAERVGWGLVAGGLALWVVTRALAGPIMTLCRSNGCAYGYLESTHWVALSAVTSGAIVVGLNASDDPRALAWGPWLGAGVSGWSVGGRF